MAQIENNTPDNITQLADELQKIAEDTSYQLVRNQVFDVLKKNIILGKLQDGERIVEGQIAQMAGISRIPVREAFRMLEAEGFLANLPRRGTRVIGVSDEDIREIFRVRGMIEQIACDYIVEQAADETLAEGKRVLEEAARAIELYGGGSPIWKNDFSQMFNAWISKASGRRRLGALYEQYNGYIALLRQINFSDTVRQKQALQEHIAIWNALAARSKARARYAVRRHAENSLNALLQFRKLSLASGMPEQERTM